jgi:hypothetical protein
MAEEGEPFTRQVQAKNLRVCASPPMVFGRKASGCGILLFKTVALKGVDKGL